MSTVEKFFAALMAALVVIGIAATFHASKKFTRACEDAGGVVVFDGRQNQCITKKGHP